MSQIVTIEITTNAITLAAQNAKVSEEQQAKLIEVFHPFFAQAGEWFEKAKELEVTEASQTDKMQLARAARLELKKVRLATEAKRKELKEDYLRTGQAIDKVAKTIKDHIKPIEAFLQRQEDFIQLQEAKLHAERLVILKAYEQYVDISYKNLGKLTQEAFDEIHQDTKEAFEYTKEQERLAEERRIADERAKEAEAKRLAEENRKLRAAQRLAEEEALKEKKRAAAEQEAKLEAQRKLEELEREQQEAEARKLKDIQEQLAREEAIKERERLVVEKEQELELKETVEKDWSVLEQSNLSDKEQLELILQQIKDIEIKGLQSQKAKSIGKRTTLLIKNVEIYLERAIKTI